MTFLDSELRTRRDHPKYLALIRSIALLHQYQRPVKQVRDGSDVVSYIEVIPSDIELANRLAGDVLGRSLDEIPLQTRRLLLLLEDMVKFHYDESGLTRAEVRFSRREVRQFTAWSDTALKVHMARLVDLEYLLIHRGRGQSYVYELLYDGQGKNGQPFCMGLADASMINDKSESADESPSGKIVAQSGGGQPSVSPRSGGGHAVEISAIFSTLKSSRKLLQNRLKMHV